MQQTAILHFISALLQVKIDAMRVISQSTRFDTSMTSFGGEKSKDNKL